VSVTLPVGVYWLLWKAILGEGWTWLCTIYSYQAGIHLSWIIIEYLLALVSTELHAMKGADPFAWSVVDEGQLRSQNERRYGCLSRSAHSSRLSTIKGSNSDNLRLSKITTLEFFFCIFLVSFTESCVVGALFCCNAHGRVHVPGRCLSHQMDLMAHVISELERVIMA
jgi:hypothetical protein